MTEPSSTSPAGAGIKPADLGELTREVIADTASAVPPVGPAQKNDVALDPVDAYGRAFDPTMHLVRADGSPARHPRTGALYCKPGMGGGPRRRPPAAAAAGQAHMEIEGAPASSPQADFKAAAGHQLQPEPVYSRDDAVSGAELITDATELLARMMAGDDAKPTDEELTVRRTRWGRWMEANSLSIPFARFGQAVFGEAKYLARVYQMPAAQEKVARCIRWLNGEPEPPKVRTATETKQGQTHAAPVQEIKPLVEIKPTPDGEI